MPKRTVLLKSASKPKTAPVVEPGAEDDLARGVETGACATFNGHLDSDGLAPEARPHASLDGATEGAGAGEGVLGDREADGTNVELFVSPDSIERDSALLRTRPVIGHLKLWVNMREEMMCEEVGQPGGFLSRLAEMGRGLRIDRLSAYAIQECLPDGIYDTPLGEALGARVLETIARKWQPRVASFITRRKANKLGAPLPTLADALRGSWTLVDQEWNEDEGGKAPFVVAVRTRQLAKNASRQT